MDFIGSIIFGIFYPVDVSHNCLVQVFHLAYFGDLSAELPDWAASLACTSHLLLVTNSSTNILVYCWKDDKFRLVLVQTLGLHKLRTRQTRQRERRGHMVMEKIATLVTNTDGEAASAEL